LAGQRGLGAFLQLELVPELEGLYLEALKAFARGIGLEPEKVLIQSEFAEPHRAYATSGDTERKLKQESSAWQSRNSLRRSC